MDAELCLVYANPSSTSIAFGRLLRGPNGEDEAAAIDDARDRLSDMYSEPTPNDLDSVSRPRRAVAFARTLFKKATATRSPVWLRLALTTDVKVKKAAQKSRFYVEHGRPLGGRDLEASTSLGKRLGEKRKREGDMSTLDDELDRWRSGENSSPGSKRMRDDRTNEAEQLRAQLDAELDAYTAKAEDEEGRGLEVTNEEEGAAPVLPEYDDTAFNSRGDTREGLRGWAMKGDDLKPEERGEFPDSDGESVYYSDAPEFWGEFSCHRCSRHCMQGLFVLEFNSRVGQGSESYKRNFTTPISTVMMPHHQLPPFLLIETLVSACAPWSLLA